jgi:hypothetical protein
MVSNAACCCLSVARMVRQGGVTAPRCLGQPTTFRFSLRSVAPLRGTVGRGAEEEDWRSGKERQLRGRSASEVIDRCWGSDAAADKSNTVACARRAPACCFTVKVYS